MNKATALQVLQGGAPQARNISNLTGADIPASRKWMFTMVFDNSDATNGTTDKMVIINPSFAPSSVNTVTDGSQTAASGGTILVNNGGGATTIKQLLSFAAQNQLLCIGFRIDTTDTAQMSKSMKIVTKHPFSGDVGTRVIPFNQAKSSDFNDKKLEINEVFVFDLWNEIQMNVSKLTTTTLTFEFAEVASFTAASRANLAQKGWAI